MGKGHHGDLWRESEKPGVGAPLRGGGRGCRGKAGILQATWLHCHLQSVLASRVGAGSRALGRLLSPSCLRRTAFCAPLLGGPRSSLRGTETGAPCGTGSQVQGLTPRPQADFPGTPSQGPPGPVLDPQTEFTAPAPGTSGRWGPGLGSSRQQEVTCSVRHPAPRLPGACRSRRGGGPPTGLSDSAELTETLTVGRPHSRDKPSPRKTAGDP